MDSRIKLAAPLCLSLFVFACGGGGGGAFGKGSSAPPPTGVAVTAGDQSAFVTFDYNASNVYWAFIGPPGTTPNNFASETGAFAFSIDVSSPYTIASFAINGVTTALVNGASYDVTLNARTNGGPGGPSTNAIRVVPRAAGSAWTAQSALVDSFDNNNLDALYGGDYGLPLYNNNGAIQPTLNPAVFLLVGANGAAFVGNQTPNGVTYAYSPVKSGIAAGSDLTAVAYAGNTGFVAVGTNGVASLSLDGQVWTPQTTGIGTALRAIAPTSGVSYIAVGDNCEVFDVTVGGTPQYTVWNNFTAGFTSSPGFTTPCSAANPLSLRGVSAVSVSTQVATLPLGFASGILSPAEYLIVVGDQGTVAYSGGFATTAANWNPAAVTFPPGVTAANVTLRGVIGGFLTPYTTPILNGTQQPVPLWVAVGDYTLNGVTYPLILYSPNVTEWTYATLPAGLTGHLRAVKSTINPGTGQLTQIFAVGDNGLILSNQLVTPQTINNLVVGVVTSTPAITWTKFSGSTTPYNLNTVFVGHQELQVGGDAGTTLYSY